MSWKSVGEVVRGQMGRREKFMEDVEGVRYRRGRVRERQTQRDTAPYYTLSHLLEVTDSVMEMQEKKFSKTHTLLKIQAAIKPKRVTKEHSLTFYSSIL